MDFDEKAFEPLWFLQKYYNGRQRRNKNISYRKYNTYLSVYYVIRIPPEFVCFINDDNNDECDLRYLKNRYN